MTDERAPRGRRRGAAEAAEAAQVQALLAASRVLVAISAQSIAAVEDTVDLAQFRALVIVASNGSASLGELAEAAGLPLSTASRTCDRLVGLGLLDRSDDPANRRQLRLTLTRAGEAVVTRAWRHRQEALEPVLGKLPEARRRVLVESLTEFADAAGAVRPRDLWFLGWPTDGPATSAGPRKSASDQGDRS